VSISRFSVPPDEELPADLRGQIDAVHEKLGFTPNVFRALAHRPDELRAFSAYHDALMDKEGGLSKAEREMIVVATSAERHCPYCVVAHGAILRIRTHDPLVADLIATNYRQAPITSRQKAMLDFAMKVSTVPETIGEDDLRVLREHGFSDEDVWDIGAIAAFFALSNRMAHLMALQPNPEFHLLGRLPK
jgi:uncharacterized peroxidase-related enzyme